MKLRVKNNGVVKYFKDHVIESFAGHIIPTKITIDVPTDNYSVTLIESNDGIIGKGLVNWGDGSVTNLIDDYAHMYAKAGEYTIEGQFIFTGSLPINLQNILTGIEYLSNKHDNRSFANLFGQCPKLERVKQKRCKLKPTDMHGTFADCDKLKSTTYIERYWDLNNVTNMTTTFDSCYNLTGSPVCGPNVTNMYGTYYHCQNLTGSPACGPNVVNMNSTYKNCYNITGNPVCGPNVTDMYGTYYHCQNLTGSPECGPKVNNMNITYNK